MIMTHNFDIDEISERAKLSFYDRVKIINYIRKMVQEGKMNEQTIMTSIGKRPWDSIRYLFPTFEGDQLLYAFEACNQLEEKDNKVDTKDLVIEEDAIDHALIRSTSVLKNM